MLAVLAMLGGVSATYLDKTIQNSPIVQKRVLPAVYIGAAYDFGGHKREVPIPFGPYLVGGGIAAIFFGQPLTRLWFPTL